MDQQDQTQAFPTDSVTPQQDTAEDSHKSHLVDSRAKWRTRFLKHFRRHGNATRACKAVGIDRSTVTKARRRSSRFDKAYRQAHAESRRRKVDAAEDALFQRGVHGWSEPVYQMGRKVGTKRKFSDPALFRVLEAEAGKKYKPDRNASAPSVNVMVNVEAQRRLLEDPALQELASEIAARMAAPKAIEA